MTMGVVPVAKRKPMLPGKALVRMGQNPVTSVIRLLSTPSAVSGLKGSAARKSSC